MSINDIKLGLCAHLAAIVFLHAALMIPPSRLSHKQLALAFPTLIWSCHIYSWSVGLGFLATIQALWATELLLFRAPREQFQLIHTQKPGSRTSELKSKKEQGSQNQEEIEQDDKKEQRPIWKEPYPGTFWKRFWWVFKLQVSLRYVGWDTGDGKDVTSLLRERRQYRLQWLLKKVLFMGICFSIVDLTNFYQHFDPYFQIETDIDAAFPHQLGDLLAKYHLGSLPPRLLRISALGFQQYAVFALTNTLMAIIHVTLGGIGLLGDFWGEIEYWPPLMGSPLVTLKRGLRGFWGEFWHQLFRNILTSPGKAIATALQIPPKSLPAYGIQVVVAFVLSGALHAATLPLNVPNVSPLRYAAFFWIQGVCVLAEAVVEQTMKRRFSGRSRSCWMRSCVAIARLAWTLGVLYFTVPMIVDELTKLTRGSRRFGLRPIFLLSLPK